MKPCSLLFVVSLVTCAAACGSSSGGTGGSTPGTGGSSSMGTGGSSATGTGGSSATGTGGSSSTGTGGSADAVTVMVTGPECFELATGKVDTANPCTFGDLVFLTGAMVDLDSKNQGEPAYCPQTGSFTDLASVPSDDSACAWTSYVEGGVGLANTGYIVRDAAGAHHYKMQIVSNTLPSIVFRYAKID